MFYQEYGTIQIIGIDSQGKDRQVIQTKIDYEKPLHTYLKKDRKMAYRLITKLNEYGILNEDTFVDTKTLKKLFPSVGILDVHDNDIVRKVNPSKGERSRADRYDEF